MLLRKGVIWLFLCVTCSKAISQRYNFITYGVDNGLPQSQVSNITQAADGQLWMSTYGGISRFDGKTFHNYTTTEGLAATYPIHFVLDQQQRVWAVTSAHLNCIAGNKVYRYPLPQVVNGTRARLAVTDDGIVWCLVNGVLYSFRDNKFVKANIAGFPVHAFLALIPGEKHITWLMAPHRTLYGYKAGAWQRFTTLVLPDSSLRVRNVYIDSAQTVWVQTQNGIMVQRTPNGEVQPWFSLADKSVLLYCVTKDRSGNFWVGGNTGAYRIKPDKSFVHFDYTNGFSTYRANDVFSDMEGNIWLGTDGDGLLKYAGGVFTVFDTGNPAGSKVQIATADAQGRLFYGNAGNDFCLYDGRVKRLLFQNTDARYSDIIFAYTDLHNVVWIGTVGTGLWKYEKGVLARADFIKNAVYGICENDGDLFLRTDDGLVKYSKGRLQKNPVIKEYVRHIIPAGKDSFLVARQYGIALMRDSIKLPYTFPAELQRTTVAAFAGINDKLFIGTMGEGIFVWDKTTGTCNQVTTAQGLATNIIYSLLFDHNGQLWAGTGKGVSRLVSSDHFHTITVRNYDKEQGFNGLECNGNAIAVLPNNTVWFGTTKGFYCYHPDEDRVHTGIPKLTLQSVKLFYKPLLPQHNDDTTGCSALAPLPRNPVLPYRSNHITFEFGVISFVYSNIRYSYYLQGLENNFSVPGFTNSVVYPSLPPGEYVFNVKAIDETGKQTGNMVTYPFEIRPAFYQTLWFKGALLFTMAALIFVVYRIRKNRANKQQALVEQLRNEEQGKIRKKTAQDFHDEMGNKLARIIVLTDILKTKLPAHDEAQGLAQKIQENVGLLYQGTKDMIWSLNPENDNLSFLLAHINSIGIDLFADTGIEFEPMPVNEAFSQYYLPMDHARNIIMICKEVFTNACKHAQCTRVTANAVLTGRHTVQLTIADNGKSFDTETSYNGNGLANIKQRISYLNAGIQWQSEAGKGTCLTIIFKVPPVRRKKANR